MKLYFLKQKSLDMLEQGISDNLNKYQDAETWVDQYFIEYDKLIVRVSKGWILSLFI